MKQVVHIPTDIFACISYPRNFLVFLGFQISLPVDVCAHPNIVYILKFILHVMQNNLKKMNK
jgi:hypothetical protein